MNRLRQLLILVAVITIISGLTQIVSPAFVLRTIGAEVTPTSAHFFGLVGMFMALFGGALWQALANPANNRVVIFWSGLQKVGAVVGVVLGVYRNIFSNLALGVAAFDLVSAILILYYWLQAKNPRL